MSYTNHQIQAAINAAESAASVLLSDTHPVAVTNATLLALIAGAKQEPESRAVELQEAIDSAINTLKNA